MELKKKKNAAGNYPTLKRMTVPVHSSWRKSLSSDYFNSFSGDLMEEVEKISDVGSGLKSSKTPAPELYDIVVSVARQYWLAMPLKTKCGRQTKV